MGWTISLGRIAGTAVKLHLTFLLFLIWLGAVGWAQGGAPAAAGAVSFILLLFLCVTLHEFGHILAARRFGVKTPEIILLPIGGVSKLERIPESPREELIIAIAGPLVTLAIAAALVVALGGLPPPQEALAQISPRAIAAQLAYANITLFFFNLLPAFPLDGGRVLRAILSHFTGHLRGTEIAATIGRLAALLLGLAALMMGHIILLLIAMFIFIAAGAEAGMAQAKSLLFNLPVRDAMISEFRALQSDSRVADAAGELIRTSQAEFPIVDRDQRLLGVLTRNGIIKALTEKGGDTAVTEAMRTDIPVMGAWQRLDDALDRLQGGAPAIAVTGPDGRLVGLITPENLAEKMMIARARARRPGHGYRISVPSTKI